MKIKLKFPYKLAHDLCRKETCNATLWSMLLIRLSSTTGFLCVSSYIERQSLPRMHRYLFPDSVIRTEKIYLVVKLNDRNKTLQLSVVSCKGLYSQSRTSNKVGSLCFRLLSPNVWQFKSTPSSCGLFDPSLVSQYFAKRNERFFRKWEHL